IWGKKRKAAFFRNLGEAHQFDSQALHGEWPSLQSLTGPLCQDLPFDLFHLRMIEHADREARRERYNRLDPDKRYQAIGYDYLTDERGLKLRALAPHQDYRGRPTVL